MSAIIVFFGGQVSGGKCPTFTRWAPSRLVCRCLANNEIASGRRSVGRKLDFRSKLSRERASSRTRLRVRPAGPSGIVGGANRKSFDRRRRRRRWSYTGQPAVSTPLDMTIKPPRVASAPIDTAVITTIVAPDYLLRRLLAGGKQSCPGWCPGNPAVANGVAAHFTPKINGC